ncbi:anti-sigma factor domain-containing protein [Paenarthrobacter aurescens]|nr:anti-sigma factor [Paenarthrobacter aurescens]MDO6144140.1 anti-sigma factor [Paenarthrobacter aurescens]MDO6147987.1 anti-sigma factor [Paenarthrobacter aurescens]MDO6159231.1 anti-sigma factor [Paenarthrobacter aurescens]MDO6163215.1 anti-sigma factor [Paenarthrobacter aurescens]
MSENTSGGFIRRMFANDIATDLAEGRVLELAELYALDAVSDDERDMIDRFIKDAPEGAEFLERVREARETLAVSFAPEEAPPAGLLDNIMERIAQDTAQTAAEPAVAPEAGPAVDDLALARAKREERTRAGGARRWIVGAAAAAVIALGGIGVGAYVSAQNDPVNQVLQAQDVQQKSAPVPGGGTATISASSAKDSFVVLMDGVAPAPEGKVYQLWTLPKDGSAPVPQGTMDAETLSKPAVVKGLSSASSVAITVEPTGGSSAPTTDPVLVVGLSA